MMNQEHALYDIAEQTEWENAMGPALILLLPSSVPVRNTVVTYTLTEEQYRDIWAFITEIIG